MHHLTKEPPMAAIAPTEHPSTRSRMRVGMILLAAAVAAILLNAAVAAVAVAAGAPSGYGPLTPPAYGLFTVLGVGLGWLGWRLVLRHSRDPRRTLSVLVPIVLVVSFIPDVLLLALRFIPGTTTSAAIALMVMHVVVVLVAVPAYVLATRQRTQVRSGSSS
jgi:hypothetical protein